MAVVQMQTLTVQCGKWLLTIGCFIESLCYITCSLKSWWVVLIGNIQYSHSSCWTQRMWLGWRSGRWRGCCLTPGLSSWRILWSPQEDCWSPRRMRRWQVGMQSWTDCRSSGFGSPGCRTGCGGEPGSECGPDPSHRSPLLSPDGSPECH